MDDAPNAMEDLEGYLLWCELHRCPACAGVGEEDDPPWICGVCQGSGIREDGRDD